MKIEVYLGKGERKGMIKAELYIDGVKPFEARVAEFPQEKIVELFGNFYNELRTRGIANIGLEVKDKGSEKEVCREIRDQISRRLKSRNAKYN